MYTYVHMYMYTYIYVNIIYIYGYTFIGKQSFFFLNSGPAFMEPVHTYEYKYI